MKEHNSPAERQIEQIYHSALEAFTLERGAFVAGECKGDEELRREVESLLGRDRAPGEELIDRPLMRSCPALQDRHACSGRRLHGYPLRRRT